MVVMVAIFLPRAFALDQFVTTDEAAWIVRAANFYYSIGQRDFANTLQSEHPGVTVMWAGTAGFVKVFPGYRGLGLENLVDVFSYEETLQEHGFHQPIRLLAAGRLFLISAITLILGLSFFYFQKLLGIFPALLGFLLIAFNPFHIAISRLLHLDGLLSSLILLSLIAYIYHFTSDNLLALLVSAVATGLAWLTKSPGFFLVPFVGFMMVLYLWHQSRRQHLSSEFSLKQQAQNAVGRYILWGFIGTAVFFIFWPAMWTDPIGTFSHVIQGALGHASEGHSSPIFYQGEVGTSGNLDWTHITFYPWIYIWKSTPVSLAGVLLALTFGLINWYKSSQKTVNLTIASLLLFCVVFTLFMNLGGHKIARYILSVFLVLELISALGWINFLVWLRDFSKSRDYFVTRIGVWGGIASLVVAGQVFLALRTHPYYLTYFNPMLGGIKAASQVMMIGWGEGLELAADYLNQKPNSSDLNVISWYNEACFSYFFEGNSKFIPILAELEAEKLNHYIADMDYAIIYFHQWQRQTPRNLLDYLSTQTPEHSIFIDGIEYVRIYNLSESN